MVELVEVAMPQVVTNSSKQAPSRVWAGKHWPLPPLGELSSQERGGHLDGEDRIALEIQSRQRRAFVELSFSEEVECLKGIKAGDADSLDRLVKGYQSLVFNLAGRYPGRGSLSFLDLVSEGNSGLLYVAREKWDHSRTGKHRFYAYAKYYIRQRIERAIENHGGVIRTPVKRLAEMRQMDKALSQLRQEKGRLPGHSELRDRLEELGVERLRSNTLLKLGREPSPAEEAKRRNQMRLVWTDEHINETFALLDRKILGLADTKVKSGESEPGEQTCVVASNHRTDADAELESTRALIKKALGCLTPAQRELFEVYYSPERPTISEIAQVLGITPQAASDRHAMGQKRLKSHLRPSIREALRAEWLGS